jgi:hypothetical protein
MSDSAQLYQKLLNDAIRKQMTILGPQITLIKVRNVPGLTVTDAGAVATLSNNPEDVVTNFLEEFRDLSSPLVKKTMQPLLSAIGPTLAQASEQPKPEIVQGGINPEHSENQTNKNQELGIKN